MWGQPPSAVRGPQARCEGSYNRRLPTPVPGPESSPKTNSLHFYRNRVCKTNCIQVPCQQAVTVLPRCKDPSQGLVFGFLFLTLGASATFAQGRDQIAPTLSQAHHSFTVFAPRGHANPAKGKSAPASSFEFDSIQTFQGAFQTPGVGPTGVPRRRWFYTMAGSRPEQGGATTFHAPIVPVSLDLLDRDGSVRVINGQRLHYAVQPFVALAVNSPIFQNAEYSSSDAPTQFVDAM